MAEIIKAGQANLHEIVNVRPQYGRKKYPVVILETPEVTPQKGNSRILVLNIQTGIVESIGSGTEIRKFVS